MCQGDKQQNLAQACGRATVMCLFIALYPVRSLGTRLLLHTVVYAYSLTCLYSVPHPPPTPDYLGDILKKAGGGYLFNYIKQMAILNAHISVHVCIKL